MYSNLILRIFTLANQNQKVKRNVMKKLVFLLIALIGFTAYGQSNVVKQTVVIDSIQYNVDSVPRVYFKIVRQIQDTLFRMSSTPAELTTSLKIAQERVKFTDKTVAQQIAYLKDSIQDQVTKQYVLQQVSQQNNSAIAYRTELEMLKVIRKKFIEQKIIRQ